MTEERPDSLSVGRAVRFTGGRFNGFEGQVAKLCDRWASVMINFENKLTEIIEETKWLTPLEIWQAGRTATELSLKGAAPQS